MTEHICKVCGKISGKSKTCKQCKIDIPYHPSAEGSLPFNRFKEWSKKK